jgi:hypothetical protein
MANSTIAEPPKPKLCWHQFSLQSLLLAMFVSIVAFGGWLYVMRQRAQAHRERAAAVERTVTALKALGLDVRSKYVKRRSPTWREELFDDPGGANDPVGNLTLTRVDFFYTDPTVDARISSAVFNRHTLRAQLQLYKAQHGGRIPSADLSELIKSTNLDGTDGTEFGPYLQAIPVNNLTDKSDVKTITGASAAEGDLTPGGGGWIYSTTTGNIWIDHADYYTE